MQIFEPVQLVVLAAEGKNLDRGRSSSGRAVKILSGHRPSIKTIHVYIFRPVLFLVSAAEGKTCLLFGAL